MQIESELLLIIRSVREHMSETQKYCVGIDLGGTFIKFVALGRDFRPGPTLQLPTPVQEGPDGVAKRMVAGLEQLMQSQRLSREDVLGVGIGAPGPLNLADGIVVAMPNIPGMENVPLRDLVSEGAGIPAVLENDANAAAYGEFLCGAGLGARHMVLVTLGTGIGGGIIIDGKIYHGANTFAGEIGHIIVDPEGEECGCGQKGCLERYCSATYIAKRAERMIRQEGRTGKLAELLRDNGAITARDVQLAAEDGDKFASEVWDSGMYFLALGCVNICRLLDPDRIVFAGGMAKAGDGLLGPVRKHFKQLHWSLTDILTKIEIAGLGNDAGVIGAAGVAWNAFD